VERNAAEEPVRDPLLDSTRIIVLAQRLARAQVHGPDVDALEADQTAEAS
jgi:hypothetical protein